MSLRQQLFQPHLVLDNIMTALSTSVISVKFNGSPAIGEPCDIKVNLPHCRDLIFQSEESELNASLIKRAFYCIDVLEKFLSGKCIELHSQDEIKINNYHKNAVLLYSHLSKNRFCIVMEFKENSIYFENESFFEQKITVDLLNKIISFFEQMGIYGKAPCFY